MSLPSEPGRPSSEIFGDKVNHIGKAHRIPFLTPNTPWRFSTPFDRKATKRPHFGRTRAWKKEVKFNYLQYQNLQGKKRTVHKTQPELFSWNQCDVSLIHFSPVSYFYTPCKRQKTKGFLTFSGDIEMWNWTKMG